MPQEKRNPQPELGREQITPRLPVGLGREAGKEKKSRQITLRIQEGLFHELKRVSNQMGLTVTALLIVTIWWNVLGPEYSRR